jgi:3'(2'), 5'-bisphosphate nucleotidase
MSIAGGDIGRSFGGDIIDADLVAGLFATAQSAGEAIMAIYARGFDVERKADASPVTAADRAAEDIILRDLASLAPGVPVIAEEAVSSGDMPAIGTRFFLVDPLDGTKEFINRSHEFTVNIALVEQRVPVFGLIYAPALGELYITLARQQAVSIKVTPGARVRLDQVEHAPLKTRTPPAAGMVASASRSHMNEDTLRFLASHDIRETARVGSSLKFCILAAGQADVYPRLGPTCEWDIAAGHAILAAAGGVVLCEDGAPLAYGKSAQNYLNPSFIAWGRKPAG